VITPGLTFFFFLVGAPHNKFHFKGQKHIKIKDKHVRDGVIRRFSLTSPNLIRVTLFFLLVINSYQNLLY